MSLVLVWESPFATWEPVTGRVQVFRTSSITPNAPKPDDRGFRVDGDSTWNCAIDPEETDVNATYQAFYYSRQGQQQFIVCDQDIERFVLDDSIAIAEFCLKSPIGVPEAGRRVEISDLTSGTGERFYHFLSNREGKVKFPLRRGRRLFMRIHGNMDALDFVVPNKPNLTLEDLRAAGSVVDADRRGWY